jgi:hypothetical protein
MGIKEKRESVTAAGRNFLSSFPLFRFSGETRTRETENDSKWNEEREAISIL